MIINTLPFNLSSGPRTDFRQTDDPLMRHRLTFARSGDKPDNTGYPVSENVPHRGESQAAAEPTARPQACHRWGKTYRIFSTVLRWLSLGKDKCAMREPAKESTQSSSTSEDIKPGASSGQEGLDHQYPQVLRPLMQKLAQVEKSTDLYHLLNSSVQEITGFKKLPDANIYTYQGYTFFASTHLNQKTHQSALKVAEQQGLKSAPQLVDALKIDDHYCVVVTKTPDLNGDKALLPYKMVEGNMEGQDLETAKKFIQAKRNFYQEMKQLAQNGYIHPMMQSKELTNYLSVHPVDGHIMLNSWNLVVPLSGDLDPDMALHQLADELLI